MNDVPVARQSRDPARPQAGEYAALHHKGALIGIRSEPFLASHNVLCLI